MGNGNAEESGGNSSNPMSTQNKPAKFLGWANGWKGKPPEIQASKDAGHRIESTERGNVTTVKCVEGGWYYKVDSSG